MKTILEYAGILLLSVFLIWRGIVPAWNSVHSDFANYFVSSRLIVEKADLQNLYDNNWFQRQIADHGIDLPGKFAPFPPLTAWIMLPLTPFDPLTAQRIWTFFNLTCLGLSIYLLGRITSWNWSVCTLFVLLNGLGLANNFAFGQVYLFMSTAILLAYFLTITSYPLAAAGLIGFFTAVKYFPVVYLPGYFIGHFRRLVYSVCIVGIILFALQWIIFGRGVMVEFISQVLLPHLDGDLTGQDPFSYQFQSWDGFFRHAFVADFVANPEPWIHWTAGRIYAKVLLYLVVGIFTGIAFWKGRQLPEPARLAVTLSLPALAALALLPASATYHFVLLVFPVALLLQPGVLQRRDRIIILLLYAATGFIPYHLAFSLADRWGMIFAYPRLWILSLLWLYAMVAVSRKSGHAPLVTTSGN